MEIGEVIEELRFKGHIYRLLAHLYKKEVSTELVEAMEDQGLWALLEAQGYEIEADRLKNEGFIEKLAVEYAKLFIGPGPHIPPYGSVHHPDERKGSTLWGDTTIWVRRFIMDHGLKFEGNGYDGIPDHISHELEFFSYLLDREAQAREDDEMDKVDRLMNSERKLYEEQLSKWVPAFCKKVEERTTHGFYKAVCRMTTDFLEMESERLGQS